MIREKIKKATCFRHMMMKQAPGLQGKTMAFLFGLQGTSIIFACPNDHYFK
jgi:hypothetical protein